MIEFKPGDVVKAYGQLTVEIIDYAEGSRTRVRVRDIDKGKGWDPETKKYKGIQTVHGWMRGENYSYGKEYIIHINQLEK